MANHNKKRSTDFYQGEKKYLPQHNSLALLITQNGCDKEILLKKLISLIAETNPYTDRYNNGAIVDFYSEPISKTGYDQIAYYDGCRIMINLSSSAVNDVFNNDNFAKLLSTIGHEFRHKIQNDAFNNAGFETMAHDDGMADQWNEFFEDFRGPIEKKESEKNAVNFFLSNMRNLDILPKHKTDIDTDDIADAILYVKYLNREYEADARRFSHKFARTVLTNWRKQFAINNSIVKWCNKQLDNVNSHEASCEDEEREFVEKSAELRKVFDDYVASFPIEKFSKLFALYTMDESNHLDMQMDKIYFSSIVQACENVLAMKTDDELLTVFDYCLKTKDGDMLNALIRHVSTKRERMFVKNEISIRIYEAIMNPQTKITPNFSCLNLDGLMTKNQLIDMAQKTHDRKEYDYTKSLLRFLLYNKNMAIDDDPLNREHMDKFKKLAITILNSYNEYKKSTLVKDWGCMSVFDSTLIYVKIMLRIIQKWTNKSKDINMKDVPFLRKMISLISDDKTIISDDKIVKNLPIMPEKLLKILNQEIEGAYRSIENFQSSNNEDRFDKAIKTIYGISADEYDTKIIEMRTEIYGEYEDQAIHFHGDLDRMVDVKTKKFAGPEL